jgi:type I restriction enzyme S subunit
VDGEDCIISSSYTVFEVIDKEVLSPEYLMLWFIRKELDRYARYNSWGSARETFTFDEMQLVEIPIPDIKIQKSIVKVYKSYIARKEINEKLKAQIKDICPILIKGSLEEGK